MSDLLDNPMLGGPSGMWWVYDGMHDPLQEVPHARPAGPDLRSLVDDEAEALRTLAHGRTVEARLCDRVRICRLAHQGRLSPKSAPPSASAIAPSATGSTGSSATDVPG